MKNVLYLLPFYTDVLFTVALTNDAPVPAYMNKDSWSFVDMVLKHEEITTGFADCHGLVHVS